MINKLLQGKAVYLSIISILLFGLNDIYAQQVKLPTDTTFSENLSMDPNKDMYPGEEFDIHFQMTGFPPGTVYTALIHKNDDEINIGTTTTGTPIHAKVPLDIVPGRYGIKVVAASGLPARPKTILIRDSTSYDPYKWSKVSGNESGKLIFTGTGERAAVSKPLDFTPGGFTQVSFSWLQTANANSDVYIEYSTDYGKTWNQGLKLSTTINYEKFLLYNFPPGANSDHTMIRFIQPNYVEGADSWRINLVLMDMQGNVIMPDYYENIHFTVVGPSIALAPLPSRKICAGQSTSYAYTTNGTFPEGTIFTVQISSSNGLFENPTDIGSLAGTTGGTINVTFPDDIKAGPHYRIRIVAVAGDKHISASNPSPYIELGEYLNYSITKDANLLTAPEGTSYQWYKGNQLLTDATARTYEPIEPGNYHCQVTGNDGCTYNTSSIDISILGTFKKLAPEHFTLYPNPSSDKITLTSLKAFEGEIEVSLYNSIGEKIYGQNVNQITPTLEINLDQIKRGLYYLTITHKNERIYKPVIKL